MAEYQFGNLIGSGGFGTVFEGKRLEDDWPCAIKQIRYPFNDDELKRFCREVRLQEKLRHENIVQIIGHNFDDEQPWFVMPKALYSLKEYLEKNNGESQIWLIYQIAAGIIHAHENGVIHRDLKPDNILFFTHDGNHDIYVAVSDFGLGRFFDRDTLTITQTNIAMGTIQYMAPEQFRDARNVDYRADIYTLGKIFYEILTGDVPYPNVDFSKVPQKFRYILRRACEDDPTEIYQNVKEMIHDLDLVTKEERSFTKPAKIIRSEVQAIIEALECKPERIKLIAETLVTNTSDSEVLTVIFPQLLPVIIKNLIKDHKIIFGAVINSYDEAVSGPLPFEYCDVVADFYEKVFSLTDSDDVKIMILKRLPKLGHDHNRFHVGGVFARIISGIDEHSLVLEILEILKSDESVARWCKPYLDQHSIPSVIREFLNEL